MSGIVGIYYRDNRAVNPADLQQMVNILAHRGPDGADMWHQGAVGLGHRMLWTTPESMQEQLPLVWQGGALAITADARIDNRYQLIAALNLKDRPASTISDSELILAAYEKWGKACPKHLLGAFAFVIWDGRKQQFFCARDHIGIKPFYYHCSAKLFAFASELKALICLEEMPRRLNEVMVGDYLASMFEDKVITFYQDILRLPPAHSMTVSQEAVQIESYWSLDPSSETNFKSDQEYAEAFREVFTEAVACRLRSAYPTGSALSGGLDSSAIVCVARDLLAHEGDRQLHTFSYIYEDVPQCDERPFIEAVLQQGNLVSHYVRGDQQSPLVDCERVLWHHDEAFVGPNAYLPWGLGRTAKQADVRVLLDGFDGDTVVSHGFAYLTELAYKGQWATFAEEAEHLGNRFDVPVANVFKGYGTGSLEELARHWKWLTFAQEVNRITQHFDVSRRQLWLQQGVKPLVPKSFLQAWRKLRGRPQPVDETDLIFNPRFAQRIGLKARIKDKKKLWSNLPHTQKEDHWLSLTTGGLAYVLELHDKTAAAFSIEFRHPFMDKRLIEYCLALPPEQKLRLGWPRRIVRQGLINILPEQVRLRSSKANVQANFVHTLMTFERERLDKLLLKELDVMETYLNPTVVRAAYQRLTSGSQISGSDVMTIWKAINLTIWLRRTGLSST